MRSGHRCEKEIALFCSSGNSFPSWLQSRQHWSKPRRLRLKSGAEQKQSMTARFLMDERWELQPIRPHTRTFSVRDALVMCVCSRQQCIFHERPLLAQPLLAQTALGPPPGLTLAQESLFVVFSVCFLFFMCFPIFCSFSLLSVLLASIV